MAYYYIHVAEGRGGGDRRLILFRRSELATPNQSDLQEMCVRACAPDCEVVRAESVLLLFNMYGTCLCSLCLCVGVCACVWGQCLLD